MKQQVITVSAFIHEGNKVLIVKRSDTESFSPGNWELPGGHVDFGERIQDAVVREIEEETGLHVASETPFHEFTYTIDEKHYVEIIYFCIMKESTQTIILNPVEHSEYKWVTLEEFEKNHADMFLIEKGAVLAGFTSLHQ